MCHVIDGRVRDAMFEAMKALDEGKIDDARDFLKVGIFGGRPNHFMDKAKAKRMWDEFGGRMEKVING